MFLTLYEERGVGLAAPQVGISQRIYVINCDEGQPVEGELALINPQIVSVEGEQDGDEGCLSFPGMFARKKRPMRVTMRAQDTDGKWFEVTGEGLRPARSCMSWSTLTAACSCRTSTRSSSSSCAKSSSK